MRFRVAKISSLRGNSAFCAVILSALVILYITLSIYSFHVLDKKLHNDTPVSSRLDWSKSRKMPSHGQTTAKHEPLQLPSIREGRQSVEHKTHEARQQPLRENTTGKKKSSAKRDASSSSSVHIPFSDQAGGKLKLNSSGSSINYSIKNEPSMTDNLPMHIPSLFEFDKLKAEASLRQYGPQSIRRILTAYVEPPLNDTIPGTLDRGDLQNDKDRGTPPAFRIPLPLRTQKPGDLVKYEYRRVESCRDMPGKFPVDRGLEIGANGEVIVWNVGDNPTPDDLPQLEAPFCPVEADPFLPWIHDAFPSHDGSLIEFIAQNKRRCRTGAKFTKDVTRLIPQPALLQPISVQRLTETEARRLAPTLWHPRGETGYGGPRYRLAPRNESSPDGLSTRFICRFRGTDFSAGKPRAVLLGETLSGYAFDYEFVSYRKTKVVMTAKGKDTKLFWTSVLRFHCPVPKIDGLQERVANGDLVLSDGTPTLFVDVVPIRTSARFDEMYLTEDQVGPQDTWVLKAFDPFLRWGSNNVVPRVEASGRWENIPVCLPPQLSLENGTASIIPRSSQNPKPHFLSACLWASAEFNTRGRAKGRLSDTLLRLEEWIEFHLMVGFDHIYLYDNSGAHTNETSLAGIAARYPGKITRIEWPFIPCNNNIPSHDSTGERSSQYAAENSCRTRFAPFTEWIASFDTDEYFIPMGNYTNLKDVIRNAAKGGTEILSFPSSRGRLRVDACEEFDKGLRKRENETYLKAYNCDSGGTPKPKFGERARKQIYRADYVLYHFVHYSTVTLPLLEEYIATQSWHRWHEMKEPVHRNPDDQLEAVLVHAKTVAHDQTTGYKKRCHKDFGKKWLGCWVAAPWPNGTVVSGTAGAYDEEGLEYNCFVNERLERYWIPKLEEALYLGKEQPTTSR